jgi:hypothetical protein
MQRIALSNLEVVESRAEIEESVARILESRHYGAEWI